MKFLDKKISLPFLGFLQATGLVLYVFAAITFLLNVPEQISRTMPEYYVGIIMLMFFIISAVITATIVLAKSGVYFWEKEYKRAFTTLGWTVLWAIFYFSLFLMISVI